jgi:hypothetical protein
VIADQTEMPALRKHRDLIMQRPIFEMEHETAGDALSSSALNEIAVCQNTALLSAKRKSHARGPRHVARRRVRLVGHSPEQGDAGQRNRETVS